MTGKTVTAIAFADFTADESILVLFGIEVIQCILEWEKTGCVFRKHEYKGRIPHKQTAVKSCIYEVRHKSRFRLRLESILESDPPSKIIAGDVILMAVKNRPGQKMTDLLVSDQRHIRHRCVNKRVGVGILVLFVG